MTENIKHMREIVEHNLTTMALAEATVVLDLMEADARELTACIYHTAPGEMEFGGEGWTWKQQARADHDRCIAVEQENDALERRVRELEGMIEVAKSYLAPATLPANRVDIQ